MKAPEVNRRDFLKTSAASGAAAVLASAPGVSFGAAAEGDFTPAQTVEMTAYGRMCFGARPGDYDDFHKLGSTQTARFRRFVETGLHPASIADTECDEKLKAQNFQTLHKSVKQLWTDHFIAANKVRDEEKAPPSPTPSGAPPKPMEMNENEVRTKPVRETEMATWIRAVYSRRQLNEVLTDFWHNHFNVFGWDNQTAPVFAHYDRDVIRPHVFGNFRQMLEAVATSPAMLFYLDGFINQSGNPNENFARELFELHTLGAENYLGTRVRTSVPGYATGNPSGYVDGDVYEAARCLTGWRGEAGPKSADSGEFAYFEPWHDRFQKIVLGHPLEEYQPPMKDGRDVLDLLARHPGTARYIARKLCRRFISDSPSESLVQNAAKVFHDNQKSPEQIRLVMRAILNSPEFMGTSRQKIKRPFEFIAGIIRATGADFEPSEDFLRKSSVPGQRLFQWRTPDGYPDTREKWTGTTAMLDRWRICNQLVNGGIDGVKLHPLKDMNWSGQGPGDKGVVDFWGKRLLGRPLSNTSAQAILDFAKEAPVPLERKVAPMVALVLMSPEFQWR